MHLAVPELHTTDGIYGEGYKRIYATFVAKSRVYVQCERTYHSRLQEKIANSLKPSVTP